MAKDAPRNVTRIKRVKRCRHLHYSGRRCALPVNTVRRYTSTDDPIYCTLHRGPCMECQAMREAFPIRRDTEIPF